MTVSVLHEIMERDGLLLDELFVSKRIMDFNLETNNAVLLWQRLFVWKTKMKQFTTEFFVSFRKTKRDSLVFAGLLRVFVPLSAKGEGLFVLVKDV